MREASYTIANNEAELESSSEEGLSPTLNQCNKSMSLFFADTDSGIVVSTNDF
jgi:hypothetical protein